MRRTEVWRWSERTAERDGEASAVQALPVGRAPSCFPQDFSRARSPAVAPAAVPAVQPGPHGRWALVRQHEISLFKGSNSIDLQQIDRSDRSYDVIVCNHVLEHVPDYRAALRELGRVLSARGFLFLSFPDPYHVERTVDWGYPDPSLHDHYRHFGRDVEEVLRQELPDCHAVTATT